MLIGYIRASTSEQLHEHGDRLRSHAPAPDKIFEDVGTNGKQPGLRTAIQHCQPGSILLVTELSQLGASGNELFRLVSLLHDRDASLRVLRCNTDTSRPDDWLRQASQRLPGLALEIRRIKRSFASAKSSKTGRPSAFNSNPDLLTLAKASYVRNPEITMADLANTLGISRAALYRRWRDRATMIKELSTIPTMAAIEEPRTEPVASLPAPIAPDPLPETVSEPSTPPRPEVPIVKTEPEPPTLPTTPRPAPSPPIPQPAAPEPSSIEHELAPAPKAKPDNLDSVW